MRRLSSLVACALLAACASASHSGDLEPRYVALHNAFAAMGLAEVGPIQRASLAEGRELRVPLDLAAGCTTIVALGGGGVRDLDASLVDPRGAPIAHDTTRDSQATVRACVDEGGTYALALKMTAGSGDLMVATWAGGTDARSGSAGASPSASAASSAPAGTCASPIPLAAGEVSGNTTHAESAQEATCASSTSHELVYRLQLTARQRVTLDVDPRFDSVLYVRKESCEDSEAEVACNDDVSHERRSRVEDVFDPGTYYVFVDGLSNEAGPFKLKTRLADVPTIAEVCRSAALLSANLPASGTTESAFDSAEATCGEGAKAGDVAYRFDLAQRSRVRIGEHAPDFSPVVHLRRQCVDESSEVGCSDEGMTSDDVAWAGILDAGSYAVFADGTNRDTSGAFTILAETVPEQGAGVQGDGCGDALPITRNQRTEGDTFAARDDVGGKCGGGGAADVVYRFDLARRSRVIAKMAKEEGHHVLVLTRACGDKSGELACAAGIDEVLAPGTYWLAVDGANAGALGKFALDFRVRDVAAQEAACKAVPSIREGQIVKGTTDGAGDKFVTSCGGREDTQSSPDRIYRFTLGSRTHVRFTLATPSWDGVLVLRKSCLDGAAPSGPVEVRCNNDYEDTHHAKLDLTLDAGTYYALVDGHASGNSGAFTLAFEVVR